MLVGVATSVVGFLEVGLGKDQADRLSGLGAGLLSGAIVAFAVLYIEARQQERADRDRFAMQIGLQPTLDGVTLAGRDLRGLVLIGRTLRNAILIGADLRGVVLTAADLTHASLQRADLRRADLRNAQLVDARLAGARLEGADLTGANLTMANLDGVSSNEETRWPQGFERPPGVAA